MSIDSIKREIENKVTKLIQDELEKKGLVDTGKLKNSISSKVILSDDGEMKIEIKGEDYFEHLEKKFNIIDDAFSSSNFKQIEDALTELYTEFFYEKLNK